MRKKYDASFKAKVRFSRFVLSWRLSNILVMIFMWFFILMSTSVSKSCFYFFHPTLVLAQETALKKYDIDFSRNLGPIRDQGAASLCVPHVIADVFTLEIRERVSALSVAIRYFQKRHPLEEFVIQLFSGDKFRGITSSILRSVKSSTFCLSTQTSTSDVYGEDDFLLLEKYFNHYSLHYSLYKSMMVHLYSDRFLGIEDLEFGLTHWRDRVIRNIGKLFPGFNRRSLLRFLDFYHQNQTQNEMEMLNQTSYDMLGAFVESECSLKLSEVSNREIIGSELDVLLSSSDDKISTIDEVLDSNKIPIVNYDVYALLYGRKRRKSNVVQRMLNQWVGGHVSSIVGRKKVGKKYMYLLRNTFGPDCGYLPSDTEHECLSDGHIWISESNIRTHILSVIYIK